MKRTRTLKDCSPSRVKRYKGAQEPRCNGGLGCPPCWEKYRQRQMKERLPKHFVYMPQKITVYELMVAKRKLQRELTARGKIGKIEGFGIVIDDPLV